MSEAYHSDLPQAQDVLPGIRSLLLDNQGAVDLIMALYSLSHVWDDLVDGDKKRSSEDVNEAFRIALFDIKRNPFYQEHSSEIDTLLLNSYLQWQDANVLERSDLLEDKIKAYSLRVSWHQIIAYCAYIIGGHAHYSEVGPSIRRLYDESIVNFLKEMGAQ